MAKGQDITTHIHHICQTHLNADCAQLADELIAMLETAQPDWHLSGKAESWAGGILYALGTLNDWFSPDHPLQLDPQTLATLCGVTLRTIHKKAEQIQTWIDKHSEGDRWKLPRLHHDDPLPWLIHINGLMIDARYMPISIQQDAIRQGLIPSRP
jgi:hypothetical protein